MERQRVLVIEDEREMLEVYRRLFARLERRGFAARFACDGEQGLALLGRESFDMVLLDWRLPGISGESIAKGLRRDPRTCGVGLIVVTAAGTSADAVRILDSGADDYLAKPFDAAVLLARLRSLARRRDLLLDERALARFPGLSLDAAGRLRINGRSVRLYPKETELLQIFLRRPQIIHSRRYLWDALWGYESPGWEHVLEATLSSLRRKLGAAWGARVQAQRGQGYSFDAGS